MQSIMVMNIKGDSVEIFKKIWHWLFGKKEVESYEDMKARMLEEINILKIECSNLKALKAQEMYNKGIREREGTKIKGGVNTRPTTPRPNFTPPPQNPPRDFKREADEHFRQQQARRDSDDNFLMGAMVGYVIADSLNDSPSARDIEVPKSSNYESSYTPSSSSSYDSGSYSSSSDSGSSSSSCDSGC